MSLVEAVDDARAARAADAGHLRVAGEQAVDQGAVGASGAGVDGEAGGLVDDDHVGVLVEDDEVAVLGGDARRRPAAGEARSRRGRRPQRRRGAGRRTAHGHQAGARSRPAPGCAARRGGRRRGGRGASPASSVETVQLCGRRLTAGSEAARAAAPAGGRSGGGRARRLLVRAEGVDGEDDDADRDGAVGDVEGRPVVGSQVDVDEVGDGAAETRSSRLPTAPPTTSARARAAGGRRAARTRSRCPPRRARRGRAG